MSDIEKAAESAVLSVNAFADAILKSAAYRAGFEAARAAAANLCRKSEESLRSQAERAGETNDSLDSMAEACCCLAEEIEALKPEAPSK